MVADVNVKTFFATVAVFHCLLHLSSGEFKISTLSTMYLPSAETKTLKFDGKAVEQIAYDPVRKLVYAAGYEVFHVLNVNDPKHLGFGSEQSVYEDGADYKDVEVCGDQVYMTSVNIADKSKGFLSVYKRFAQDKEDSLRLLLRTEVGPSPDMVHVLKDCRTAIVMVEGKDYGAAVDPKGQVAIVKLQGEDDKITATVTSLGFEAFDDKYKQLEPFGVRFVYRGKNNKFSNDVEPEYIAVDNEENKAYVVLQGNNAIAEVDLRQLKITSIRGLGFKQWGSLDASDQDSGIRITYWPIRSWYTPDAVTFYQWHGRKLLFTANEGSVKTLSTPAFDESIKGEDIQLTSLSSDFPMLVKTAIQDETKLGKLLFSKTDGKDEAGKYRNLYSYGGRSFSIWDLTSTGDNVSALAQVFDSGSQFEEMTARYCSYLFNKDGDTMDAASVEMGPEPEVIAVGELSGRLYIFIGNEKPGTVIVYSLGRDVTKTRFETVFCEGIPDSSKTMAELYDAQEVYGLDLEDLRFYDSTESPTGRPVLMMAGSRCGSVTLLEVSATNDCNLDPDSYCSGGNSITVSSLLMTSLCVLGYFLGTHIN